MDSQVRNVMIEASRASDEERMTFPEVVMKLMQAGVERYHADLVRGDKTYYLPNGESEVVAGGGRRHRAGRRVLGSGRRRGGEGHPGRQNPVPHILQPHRRGGVRRLSRVVGRPAGPFITAVPATAMSNGFPVPTREQAA